MKTPEECLKQIYSLLTKLGWSEKPKRLQVISEFTNNKYLSHAEIVKDNNDAGKYITHLQSKVASRNRMGRGILYYLRLMGYIDEKRVNTFVSGIGTNNPEKKDLWSLSYEEMQNIYTQIKVAYEKTLKK